MASLAITFPLSSGLAASVGFAFRSAAVGRPRQPIRTRATTEAMLSPSVILPARPLRIRRTRLGKSDSTAAKVLTSSRRVSPLRISATRVRLSAYFAETPWAATTV